MGTLETADTCVKIYIVITTLYILNYFKNKQQDLLEKIVIIVTLLSFGLYFIENKHTAFLTHIGFIVSIMLLPFYTKDKILLLCSSIAISCVFISNFLLDDCLISIKQNNNKEEKEKPKEKKNFNKTDEIFGNSLVLILFIYSLLKLIFKFDIDDKKKSIYTSIVLTIYIYEILAYYNNLPFLVITEDFK